MSQNVNSAQEEASPRRLLPERLSFILDDRPVLWFEDVEAYDALLAGIVAAYDPGGVVEFMLVKDIADTQWECRRLRDLRRAGSEVELPQAAHRLMRQCYEEGTGLATVTRGRALSRWCGTPRAGTPRPARSSTATPRRPA
jgi:hypothetical protein